jgi:hypothetical protein
VTSVKLVVERTNADALPFEVVQYAVERGLAIEFDDPLLVEGLAAAFAGLVDDSSLDENLSGDQIAHVQALLSVLSDAWHALPLGENLELP